MAQLDNVRTVSTGRYKGRVPFRRTVHYVASDTWSMNIEFSISDSQRFDGPMMRFGVAGDRCWRTERHLAALDDCREDTRIAALYGARLLHHLDEAAARPAGAVLVAGRTCPAIAVDGTVLIFDPLSHLLVQVRLEDRVDTLSDYRNVGGAQVAARRVLTIGGHPDADETSTETVPGGADPKAVRVPELPRDGLTLYDTDAPRPVAWTEVNDPERDVPAAIAGLDAFIRRRGRNVSDSDGIILTAPNDTAGGERWRVAVGVEAGEPLADAREGGLHMGTWPAVRFVGIFHRGDPLHTAEHRAVMSSFMHERTLAPTDDARWQILFQRGELERAPAERMSFLRIAVR
jgi:hypothetical protein